MYKKLLINDIKNSLLVSLAVFFFLVFSSGLMSTTGILSFHLLGSIDHLMKEAKTPHFLQMHMGSLDPDPLEEFAKNHSNVSAYQALPFLNVDSSQIMVQGKRFTDSSQDNGFSYPSKDFDLLLGMDNQLLDPKEGQVYVPLSYILKGSIKTGDRIQIGPCSFLVKGPLRDSQMNTSLASSKRFLIHRKDYEKILPFGRTEYLIEFLLKDQGKISQFQRDYIEAKLPANGPSLSYPLFRLINGISDGIIIAVFLLISLLVLFICFLSIHLSLQAKIREDYREIGLLKALGLRNSQIGRLYGLKYSFLSLVAILLGFFASLPLSKKLMGPISLAMGQGPNAFLGPLFGILSCLLLLALLHFFLQRILKGFGNISPGQALRFGLRDSANPPHKRRRLRKARFLPLYLQMGRKTLLSSKKTYLSFLLVLILSSFILILPKSISSTISSDSFISYMGLGASDMYFSLQEDPQASRKARKYL